MEPVVPVAERLDAVIGREPRLRLSDLGHAQVIEPEMGGQSRLLVPKELGASPHDIGPLREATAPPAVVVRSRIELREVERDGPRPSRQVLGAVIASGGVHRAYRRMPMKRS